MVCPSVECGFNCHKRCQAKVPNLCGVNEKLLAEAIRNVKEEKKIRTRLEVCIANNYVYISLCTCKIQVTIVLIHTGW